MGCLCNKTGIHNDLLKSKHLQLDTTNTLVTKEQDIVISPASFVRQNKADFFSVYEIENFPIGSGARGQVCICIHRQSKDRRVVKIISKALIPESLTNSNILIDEVNILKTLDHPNLIRIYEFFEDPDCFYIVLEYSKGGDLFDRIVEMKNFNESQASEIMSQILSGVNYLHSKGVVHRDIKPENILLENKEGLLLKIIDFDTASLFKTWFYDEMLGTPVYMAPEMVRGKYNEKCDLWSCGIIMHILLVGGLPFDGTEAEIFNFLKNVNIKIEGPLWSCVSDLAKDLIRKLLTPNPLKRISAAEACKHPWIALYSKSASNEDISRVLTGIRKYRRTTKLKEAIHTFIVSKILNPIEMETEKVVFNSIDTNKDGTISREELTEVLISDTVPHEEAQMYADYIIGEVDSDLNGCIDYSEFLKACVKKKMVFTKENLLKAFNLFDKDGNGTIEIEELREYLEAGSKITQELLIEIMAEVDRNGDGKIDIDEFEALLLDFISRSGSKDDLNSLV